MTGLHVLLIAVAVLARAGGHGEEVASDGGGPSPTPSPQQPTAEQVAFQKLNPCPSTKERSGPCPGYAVRLIRLRCDDAAVKPSDMAWLTTAQAAAKDRDEDERCRSRP